jgi:hypothetical protein
MQRVDLSAIAQEEEGEIWFSGFPNTAHAWRLTNVPNPPSKARQAFMVNVSLPPRLCVNPRWLTASASDLFPV